jgi:hypothetical protein
LMSWIPYPTAWDANHAYMFYPKMWALNHWFYWNEPNMNTTPYLWLSYITYWFSLFVPFYNKFWIAPDTFAVIFNFLSWVFVLLFGLALIWEVLNIFSKDNENKLIINYFYLWWFLLILWLTSWMWAFLVFVDNKTDLWVLMLVILALYGWFLAFKRLTSQYRQDQNFKTFINTEIFRYLVLSSFLFAVAVASKPTAFFDVVNFGVFTTINLVSILLGISLVLLAIAILGILKFRWIVNFLTSTAAKNIFGIPGAFTFLGGILETVAKKSYNFIMPLLVWGVSFVIILVAIKGVWLIWELIFYPDRFHSLKQIILTLLFG